MLCCPTSAYLGFFAGTLLVESLWVRTDIASSLDCAEMVTTGRRAWSVMFFWLLSHVQSSSVRATCFWPRLTDTLEFAGGADEKKMSEYVVRAIAP